MYMSKIGLVLVWMCIFYGTTALQSNYGCRLSTNVSIERCVDQNSHEMTCSKEVSNYLPLSSHCDVIIESGTKHLLCTSSGQIIEPQKPERGKRFLGFLLGAAGIACAIFCGGDDSGGGGPPPNTPPKMTCPEVSTDVIASKWKTTASVSWSKPYASDREDGQLNVSVSPSNVYSGKEFSEGFHLITFRAEDKQGLSVTCSLSFNVRVIRCFPPRWPENGYLEYSNLIYGSTYRATCKDGYFLDYRDRAPVTCNKNGQWSRQNTPNCKANSCDNSPPVSNGYIDCQRRTAQYGMWCQIVCNDGFRLQGPSFVNCDKNGKWDIASTCKDGTPPRFINCPYDIQVNIDSPNNTALVDWDLPEGKDNSRNKPTIRETHGRMPNTRFRAGSHTIKYTITDSAGNIGDTCIFSIHVNTISCQFPDLNVAGGEHMMYDCPSLYRFGATCTLSCRSGYPLEGAKQITCLNYPGSDPPILRWTWTGLKPICKVFMCHDLRIPSNGALACSEWSHGDMCQLQCKRGFDVPAHRTQGLYVCGKSDGEWRPDDKVPNCNIKVLSGGVQLPSSMYYYTKTCNSSAENLEIKDNFVQALNSSMFSEACFGVPECKAEFVSVTCGPVTAKEKRSTGGRFRSTFSLVYKITFLLSVSFIKDHRTVDDVFAENERVLNNITAVIQREVVSGHFDLTLTNMRLKDDSFETGYPEFACPKGMTADRSAGSCRGCPTGRYYDESIKNCKYCPFGTYQDEQNSLSCKTCPVNTNTTEIGSLSLVNCIAHCPPGQFSPTGMQPCENCQSTHYQPNTGSTFCLPCGSGLRASTEGASKQSSCTEYDIKVKKGRSISMKNNVSHAEVVISAWIKVIHSDVAPLFSMTSRSRTFSILVSNITWTAYMNGSRIGTGSQHSLMDWFHLGVYLQSKRIRLYIRGDKVLDKMIFIPGGFVLQDGDFIAFHSDIVISSFKIFDSTMNDAKFRDWSKTCSNHETDSVYNSDDIYTSKNASLIVPSACDAVNECNSYPCGTHSQACVNEKSGYVCICKDGFTGKKCDVKPNFCVNNECKNGATCMDGLTNYTCRCKHGFRGEMCDIKAVDGQWSNWSQWTECSATCNGGISERRRECDNPPPEPDGQKCPGDAFETQICKTKTCPECMPLQNSNGLHITCNETEDLTRCDVACRPGLYFTKEPLPYYECGRITGYKWNHQNKDNPTASLPSCTNIKPPTNSSVSIDGHYDDFTCSKSSIEAALISVQSRLTSLDCVSSGMCYTEVTDKACKTGTFTISINLYAQVRANVSDLHIEGIARNKTGLPEGFTNLINQIIEVDSSAQTILNNSAEIFQVTIDGKNHTVSPGRDSLTVTPIVECPPGTVLRRAFCAESPIGSYADGKDVIPCPKGQFQDTPGQISCKMCPTRTTTKTVGATRESECTDIHSDFKVSGTTEFVGWTFEDESTNTSVIIAVTVSLVVCICAVVGTLLIYKLRRKRASDQNVKYFEGKNSNCLSNTSHETANAQKTKNSKKGKAKTKESKNERNSRKSNETKHNDKESDKSCPKDDQSMNAKTKPLTDTIIHGSDEVRYSE